MNRKEKLDEIFARVPDEKKEDFIMAFRNADSQEEKKAVLNDFGIVLTEEDINILLSDELEDDELDGVAGGCFSFDGSYTQDWS